MNQDTMSGEREKEQVESNHCPYCCDRIQKGALICKTCQEPLTRWRQTTRLLSTVLTSVVAVLSLGLAYQQYRDEKAAQAESATTKANAATESKAYENAFQRIRQQFETNTVGWQQSKQRWLAQLRSQSHQAGSQSQSSTNWAVQSDFLVRHFLDPNEKP
jgi:hypothetical protein